MYYTISHVSMRHFSQERRFLLFFLGFLKSDPPVGKSAGRRNLSYLASGPYRAAAGRGRSRTRERYETSRAGRAPLSAAWRSSRVWRSWSRERPDFFRAWGVDALWRPRSRPEDRSILELGLSLVGIRQDGPSAAWSLRSS